MRKLISLGLLALLFGFLSSPAFAGNADEFCGYLKDKNHADYQPGLYGLCTAWHNADEDAKVALGEKFLLKTGFAVPGSGLSCPCWAGVALSDIAIHTEPDMCAILANSYAFFMTETDGDDFVQTFITNGVGCVYDAYYEVEEGEDVVVVDVQRTNTDVGDFGEICINEMASILSEHFSDGSGGTTCFQPPPLP